MNFRHTIKRLALSSLMACLAVGLCACGQHPNETAHVPASAVSGLQAVQLINSKDVKTIVFDRAVKGGLTQLNVKEQEAIDHYMKMIGELRLTDVADAAAEGDGLTVTIYTRDATFQLRAEGDTLIFDEGRVRCENLDVLKRAVDADISKQNQPTPTEEKP
ncbi:MAG: hypothetical protein IJG85_02200 [Eubacteriaceae bacterium]|nr:hypothetical protein [Eubacteriaceae bacterium]